MRRALLAAALLAAALPASAQAATKNPIQLVDSKPLTARLSELTLRTPALKEDTHVRVLLPQGYDPKSSRRYPMLFLLHGCCDDYRSWSDKGNVEGIVGSLPLIVVMPDGGSGGFYSDWFNNGAGGPPEWETFHIRQLIPWIDSHYRTVGKRRGRAIAGLSMGGYGAMSYAARHPDMFVSAASFSGAVDSNNTGGAGAVTAGSSFDRSPPDSIYGPRATQEVRWRGHNPWDLAANLRGLNLTVRTGNGYPGGPYGGGPDPIEMGVHDMSVSFHQRLASLGLAHAWEDYGPGAHSWPYWQRDLRNTLPDIMSTLAKPPAPPAPFSFTAVEPRYSVYGWSVAIDRPALEFSKLSNADRGGFTLAGSGAATVVTGRLYRRGARYRVRVASRKPRVLRAGGAGRLRIAVPLGRANESQQYTPGSTTKVFSKRVRIARVHG
jgi:S-formylglutathione hydrolase FrmB